MTDAPATLTALLVEHTNLTPVRAERLAARITAEWPAAGDAADDVWTAGFEAGRAQAGTPVIDDVRLYHVIEAVTGPHSDVPTNGSLLADAIVQAILAADVVTDTEDVRRQVAADVATALATMRPPYGVHGYRNGYEQAARIARAAVDEGVAEHD